MDKVEEEIFQGDKKDDPIREWIDSLETPPINHRNIEIFSNYTLVKDYVVNNECYIEESARDWSESVADPWIVATAMTYGYTIVTFETHNTDLNSRKPSQNPKIPDVATFFNVKSVDLFYMMRVLKFRLYDKNGNKA